MTNPIWDMAISLKEFKRTLKNPRSERFLPFFVRVLCRVPFREAFRHFISVRVYKKHYPKARRFVNSDPLGAGRVPFWDFLYKQMK
ncbi:MAG TPA: hypothetical protein DDW49_05100 [Deltaproteobacteria bacterium]|nr:MAG: hypothetical protein A2048_04350 [Deltaproteobacteria bacterium GWA2_45_12]HBF12753.1 hypothetical protein [Deltaproteobacteria bacterium]